MKKILNEIRFLMKVLAALLLFLNFLLALRLVKSSGTDVYAAKSPEIVKVDITKVAGKWLPYGDGLPVLIAEK